MNLKTKFIPRRITAFRLPKPTAFTLIELLTVIAIIGILAAIIVPTVSKVRESARTATCLSNMRQIAAAMLLYAQDNKDTLPPADDNTWPNNYVAKLTGAGNPKMTDYINSQGNIFNVGSGVQTVFLCQSNIRSVSNPRTAAAATYGMNTRASKINTNTAQHYSRSCLLGCSTGPDWDLRMEPDGPAYRVPGKIAHGKYHFAFLDGHTASQADYPTDATDVFWSPNS